MKKALLLLIVVLSWGSVFSQNGWNAYIKNNVSSFLAGTETALAIDKYGNKWIGFISNNAASPAAVAKYNVAGGFWTYYCSSNTPAFLNNRVTAIACDTAGNVWIGTIAGLVKYDGTNFTSYTTANGLIADHILSLECKGNMVYIGSHEGLSRFDGAIFTNYTVGNGLLGNDTIYSIKAETPTQIWLGGNNIITELNFNSTYSSSSYNVNSIGLGSGKTNCIHIDNLGKKWLGTFNKGVIEYNNTNFILASTTYSDIISNQLPINTYDITRGPNNGVLFYAPSAVYPTPSGNSLSCLLELLPNKKFKAYYVPFSTYGIGDQVEIDANNEVFVSHRSIIHFNSLLKFMYSFKAQQYDPFMLGPGGNVNPDNYKYLDINRVKAGIANRGDMFWNVGGDGYARYEVPKGNGAHAGFNKNLWIGGLDASNQLHLAAQGYRQNGNDFWPGPLDTVNVSSDTASFINYDKIWKVSYNDINDFILNFQNGNIANNTYTPTIDIITWPAKGTGNHSRNLAPFIDVNNNGIYDPLTGGDYPQIKGDQTLYFIFNDKFAAHSESWGAPLGVEIHCTAYAYGCPNFINGKNELAYTTFYNYKIHNRSNNNYHDVKIGLYDDIDLGNYTDDYIACHVPSNLGFTYNSDGYDESANGLKGYLNYPPATGSSILKGPLAQPNDGIDNDNDGLIDEANEECLLNEFVYFNANISSFPASTTNPKTPNQYYNYLNARWRDSTDFTCGGSGYGGTTPTRYLYPWAFYAGMPCTLWSDAVNPPGDRKYLVAIGPFNLNAKDHVEFEFAKLWAVDSSSMGNVFGSVNKLISDAQKINTFYKNTLQSTCLPNMAIGIKETEFNSIEFSVYPNPTQGDLIVQTTLNDNYLIEITNVLGQMIYRKTIKTADKTTIDVSSYKSGVYFVRLIQGQAQSVKKFVKE